MLPGVVVTADASVPAMRLGADTLQARGSGGARLEVGQSRLDPVLLAQVTEAASDLGSTLAVRSSSVLEGQGEWSGAFASYVDISPHEIEKAIAGCWASAFNVATLERFAALGLEPAATPMAVLIQPVIRPEYGGVARLDQHNDVEIVGIKGSPAPLVQGWEVGVRAVTRSGGEIADAEEALAYLGSDLIKEVARQLRAAHRLTGANNCEWGFADGHLSLLQLGIRVFPSPPSPYPFRVSHARVSDRRLIDLARLARRYPGSLGEALVLAWAASDPAFVIAASPVPIAGHPDAGEDPVGALETAAREAGTLTAEVWQMPEPMAFARAASVLRQARGNHPEAALDCLAALNRPNPERAAVVLHLLTITRQAFERSHPQGSRWTWHQPIERLESILRGKTPRDSRQDPVKRMGTDRWEPFQAAVVESFGTEHQGVPASPGVGCGRLCFIARPDQVADFRSRDVVITTHPVPNLAPLLWDAAGLVTTTGSPAAHLFESARSLNVPAVCSVDLSGSLGVDPASFTGRFAAAIDGNRGLVYTSDW